MKLFSLFILFSHLIYYAHTLSFAVPRADPPDLGIEFQDFEMPWKKESYKWFFYSSVVTYSEDVNDLFKTDAQVVGLVQQAVEEAQRLQIARADETRIVGMSVLLVGKEATFASTLRSYPNQQNKRKRDEKAPSFVYDILPTDGPLANELLACQISHKASTNVNTRHAVEANCGEIIAMQLWHLAHPDEEWNKNAGARTAHWSATARKVFAPCKGVQGNKWGCDQWATRMGITWPKGTFQNQELEQSMHEPAEIKNYKTLWCNTYKQREENRIPTPDFLEDIPDEDLAEWSAAYEALNKT
ncbi:hypothetical protein NX059_004628 [Plenodomus lindquistii]|nr:hypothetical protein NX059_004628 [Plenodomus lindquistii]